MQYSLRTTIFVGGVLALSIVVATVLVYSQPKNTQSQGTTLGVSQELPLSIERSGPTRVDMQSKRTPMIIKLTAREDITGVVEEYIPSSVTIVWYGNGQIQQRENSQVLRWNIALKKGEMTELKYEYSLPSTPQQTYQLGPIMVNRQISENYWIVTNNL